ncbi:FERM central domain protein [Paragonimus heterotremus]|uniref:FERM central domain protein n=3 Tax=Paragonimus TaxID=34503 RepID=A0A8J4TN48_9TREM|nr:FERM central domain protein [Paragonimus heterotremus]
MPWTFPVGSMVSDSRSLALRVHLPAVGTTKTLAFDAQMTVAKACEHIRNQLREFELTGGAKDHGLFLPHEDTKKGLWLDNSRTLEHYILRNGDTVEYRYRYRWLYIRTMDGTRKKLSVDDSQSVAELMRLICAKMGIYNHDEYSLVRERDETDRGQTLRKSTTGGTTTLGRDQDKMEKLKRKLHTDDDMDWLNPSQSLRQQGIDENEVLLLKRRYFFSDMNVDARDPVQLNLLYVQLKDAILKGTHPVSLDEAIHLAAIQCQVQFGDYVQERFKNNFLDLKDFLPKEYAKLRSLEKKIFQQHAQFAGLTEVEAKVKYCQFCRSLKTYGITFFLVKERIKGKNKLIPRLLGVTKDSVIRLDEKTKEVLKIWPLTSISRWAASLHAFTMDFGEYSPDDCYTAQTSEGEQISQLIAGYVDIITKKQKAKDHPGLLGNEESAMYEENVRAERATIVQHQRLPPASRARPKDVGLMNGVVDEMINRQTDDYIQMTGGLVQTNGWSQHHLVADTSEVVDGQSLVNSTVHVERQMSPDNFMIGGTHIFHYQEMSPAQRSLLHTIDEDVEVLQAAKEQLHLRPGDDDVIFGVGSDETSRRWLSESMGASQAKVTDEMGAMNAAVAQALRSANRADSTYTTGQPGLGGSSDPGDDLMMMQQSFRVVTIHFPAFVDDVKRVAVLRRESGAVQPDRAEESTQNILTAARDVADAFTNLFESARPLAAGQTREEIFEGTSESATRSQVVVTHPSGPVSSSSRKAIIEAASRVGEASNDLLRHVMHEGGEEEFEVNALSLTEEERLYRDHLLSLAKAVANTTASLVVKAKNLATQSSLDPEAQQRVIAAATQTGLCTSQLVACTKVLAPTIHQPSCQQQLSEAAREVSWAVDGVVQASRAAGLASADQPPQLQQPIYAAVTDTETAATEVRDALDQLNAHLQKASAKAYTGDALDNFQLAYENLQQCHHAHDGQRMVAAARRLAQATAQMIADIKAQAELAVDDPDRQSRLFAAAKQLADATTTLIAAAKVCSSNPEDTSVQGQLRESAEQLNEIAYSAAAELLHNRLIRNLQTAARATVTGATQLVNVSQVAAKRSRGNTYQVGADAKLVNGLIPRTVISIRDSRANPDDPMTQMELISACDRFVLPCEALVRSSRSIAPTVTDPTTQAALDDSTAQLSSAVDVLRTCLARLSPLSRHLQVEGALARLARLAVEVAAIETSLKQGTLAPLPDEKVDDCFNLLSTSVQDASSSARELQSIIHGLAEQQPDVVNRSDVCGLPAVMLASAIAGLVQATRGVVARPEENGAAVIQRDAPGSSLGPAIESARLAVTQDTRQAVQLAYELVKAASDARVACDNNQRATLSTVLSHSEQLTSQLLDTLARCLRGLPGHREISEASHLIEQRREDLIQLSRSAPTRTVRWVEPVVYEQTQSDLTRAAVEFNQATGDLLSSFSPGAFRRTTRRFSGAYDYLTDKGVELSSVAPSSGDPSLQEPQTINKDLVDGLVNVSNHSHALMSEASRVCARPEEQDLRGRFQSAARDVTESISQLLVICTSGVTPDQRECELALRRLDALRPLLENPNRPVNDQNYYECVDAVAKSLAPLADSLRNMSNAVREKQNQDFGSAVRQCANSMCQLVEETAQAAYIIGLADPRSEPGRPSLVNTQLFIRTQRDIQQVCDAICDPSITNRQVIALSTEMARSAKILCEACSTVSAQTTNPEARQELNTLTRETMQGITALIQHRGSISNVDPGADLSGDWVSEANRQTTLANARAVSSHVARLVHLVTQGPQFVGQAARVTNEAREAQQPVCSAGLASLNAAQAVLRAAQTLSTNARSGHADSAYLSFSTTSKELSESIKTLAAAMRDHAPGQRECQSALDNIARLMQDLQGAKMASMEDQLQPHRELNEEGFQKQLATSVRAVLDSAPNLGRAARSEAEQLGHAVRAINSYLPGLTASAIAAASRSPLPSTQLVYLEHTSAILEAADQLITVARDAGGNPRAVHLHQNLDESVRGLMDSCEDLLTALDDIASRQGHVSTLIDTLNRSIAQTEEIIQVPVDARFADYQARLLRIARHMEQLNQAIQLRARQPSSEGELTPLAHTLTQEYQEMCQTCKGAAATLPDARQADALRSAVRAVGQASASLVQATAASRLRGSTDPQHVGQQILTLSHSRGVADLDKRAERLDAKLRELIGLLDTQGPNTQACLQSASTVSGIIADLDTTILFASSGTLHAPIHDDVDALLGPDEYRRPPYALTSAGEAITDRGGRLDSRLNTDYVTEGFAPIRESIVRTARALMDDTQSLVSGTGEDQTRLASTAHVAVERVTQLADVVKRGAVVIGPGQPDTQVDVLSSCRDVATGLRNVLQAASRTPGCRSPTDPVHSEVRTNAQLTLSSIGTLLQKVKAVEDDERRGIQALTLAAKHCREQATQLTSVPEPGSLLLTPGSSRKSAPSVTNISALSGSSSLIARYLAPDDLARAASGPLQAAVSKAILASTTQTQRDVLSTASTTRDVVTDLVAATKALLRYSEASSETRNACATSSKALAEEFAILLDGLKATLLPESKATDRERIANAARRIADLSHTLLNLLDNLREGPRLVMYFRASSPEWRDVAEKYIGRHVAYHHHYVPNYAIAGPGSTHHSSYVRPTCYPLRTRRGIVGEPNNEDQIDEESESRIDAAIEQISATLNASKPSEDGASLLRTAHSVATATRNLIRTAKSIGLAPPLDAAERARRASGSKQRNSVSCSLWRAELTLALATQDMCHLAELCSQAQREDCQTDSTDVFGTSLHLVPSKERLLAAVRRVAAASAQLLLSAKSKRLMCITEDIQKLQAAGQVVKETTDRLSSSLQQGHFSCDSSGLYVTAPLSPTLQNVIDTQAQIRSHQSELDALEQHLAQLHQEQLRSHPALFDQSSTVANPV